MTAGRQVRLAAVAASLVAVAAAAAACGPPREATGRDSAATSGGGTDRPPPGAGTAAHAAHDTAARGPTAAEAAVDADQRYLRWMLDHHAELVFLAHQALAQPDSLEVRAAARHLDETHDAETRELTAILREEFGDSYRPAIRREHVAMVTPFQTLRGDAYRRAFRAFLVTHHGEAMRATDSAVSTLRRPRVRAIAERIRSARARDVATLEREGGGRR